MTGLTLYDGSAFIISFHTINVLTVTSNDYFQYKSVHKKGFNGVDLPLSESWVSSHD